MAKVYVVVTEEWCLHDEAGVFLDRGAAETKAKELAGPDNCGGFFDVVELELHALEVMGPDVVYTVSYLHDG